jgi:hypothetical protein
MYILPNEVEHHHHHHHHHQNTSNSKIIRILFVYSKSILAVSSSLKSLKTSSSDSCLFVWFEFFEPLVWLGLLCDDELFDEHWPLIDDDRLSAMSAVAKRWTYSTKVRTWWQSQVRRKQTTNMHYRLNTNLALFSCNLQVCEDTKLQHHHSTDPPDLDRQVIVEEMIRIY